MLSYGFFRSVFYRACFLYAFSLCRVIPAFFLSLPFCFRTCFAHLYYTQKARRRKASAHFFVIPADRFSVRPLKLPDPLPDQVNDRSICRTPVILGNIMQLVVQRTVQAEAQALACFLFGEFHPAAARSMLVSSINLTAGKIPVPAQRHSSRRRPETDSRRARQRQCPAPARQGPRWGSLWRG